MVTYASFEMTKVTKHPSLVTGQSGDFCAMTRHMNILTKMLGLLGDGEVVWIPDWQMVNALMVYICMIDTLSV
jgi:hypothetical protein